MTLFVICDILLREFINFLCNITALQNIHPRKKWVESLYRLILEAHYMTVDFIEMFQTFFAVNNIRLSLVNTGSRDSILRFYELTPFYQVSLLPEFGERMERLSSMTEHKTIYFYQSSIKLCYVFFLAGPQLKRDYGCDLLFIGPFLESVLTEADYKEVEKHLNLHNVSAYDFNIIFSSIPIIPASFDLRSYMSYIGRILYGESESMRSLSISSPSMRGRASEKTKEPRSAVRTVEKRYKDENLLLAAVASGNANQAVYLWQQLRSQRIPARVSDRLRDRKNICISLNTLLRKAVQKDSIHPYHIDQISGSFALRIENAGSIEALEKLTTTMVQSYALLVNKMVAERHTPLIFNTTRYICSNYQEELSLRRLAEHFAVNPSYLSAQFKKAMGETVTAYIRRKRIEAAVRLLENTRLPVQDVADFCGFSDLNYFSRCFKREMKMSPSTFRERRRAES